MVNRRIEKRRNMMLWAMLTVSIRPDWSWRYLLEWARLGGTQAEVPRG